MQVTTLKEDSLQNLREAYNLIFSTVDIHSVFHHEVPEEVLNKLYCMCEDLSDIIQDHFQDNQ